MRFVKSGKSYVSMVTVNRERGFAETKYRGIILVVISWKVFGLGPVQRIPKRKTRCY